MWALEPYDRRWPCRPTCSGDRSEFLQGTDSMDGGADGASAGYARERVTGFSGWDNGSCAGDDARAGRRVLGGRGPADERDGHGGGDPARFVRVLCRPMGGDDGGDDAAGRGSGSAATCSCRWCARCAAVRRVLPGRLGTGGRRGVCAVPAARTIAAGAVVIAAGAYECTPLKRHFRRRCRDSVRGGFAFGLCCAGSSIGLMLMLMLVALGVMSVTWMSVIAVLVLAQKLLPAKAAIDVPLALAIAGLGILIVIAPSLVPGLMPPM